MLKGIRIRPHALARILLLAVMALSARNLEARDDSVALLDLFDGRSDIIYHTAEFVTEDVALLHLNDCAVEQMKIATADCAASHLDNDIFVLDHNWLWHIYDFDSVLALPDQRFHRLVWVAILAPVASWVRDILFSDRIVSVSNCLLSFRCCLGNCHVRDIIQIFVF